MSEEEKEGEEDQPHSMMKGDSIPEYLMKYRFANWVFYRIDVKNKPKKRRKSFFRNNRTKTKFEETYLKFHKTGRFDLFKSENNSEKPFIQYSLIEGSFKRTVRKRYEVVIHCIDIVNHDKISLHVRCLNNLDYGNLCRLMTKFGADEIDKPPPKEGTRISNSAIQIFVEKSVKEWGVSEVLEWSKCIITGEDFRETLFDIGGKYLEKHKIDGKSITDWKKKDIMTLADTLGIKQFRSKNRLKREILNLQSNKYFDPLKNIVMGKVVKMLDKQKAKKSNIIISRFTKAFGSSQVMYANIKTILYPNEEDLKKTKLFRVKLIIVENMHDDRMKRFRKVFGRILEIRDALNFVDETTKYGLFHASVSIGPLQLEWVDSSITIVRPISSEKVILCVDVDNLEVEDGEVFMKRLVKECLRWNREYQYESFTIQKNQKYANCQNFVKFLLEFLGLEYNPGKNVRSFLKRMKHRGIAQMVFQFDRKFARTFFPEKGNSMPLEFKPKQHRELDLYVSQLFRICPTFERDYPSQYTLLKGFDRAFWMKFLKDKVNKDYQPCVREANRGDDWRLTGCPFCEPSRLRKKKYDGKDEEEDENEEEFFDLPQDIKELKETIERDTGEPLSHDIVMNFMKMSEIGDKDSFDIHTSFRKNSPRKYEEFKKKSRRRVHMKGSNRSNLTIDRRDIGKDGDEEEGDTFDIDDLDEI